MCMLAYNIILSPGSSMVEQKTEDFLAVSSNLILGIFLFNTILCKLFNLVLLKYFINKKTGMLEFGRQTPFRPEGREPYKFKSYYLY